MARVPFIDPDDLPTEHRHLVHSRLGKPVNVRRALANHPEALAQVAGPAQWFQNHAELDPRLRELALLQLGYVTANAYEFSHHVVISAAAGVTDDDIRAVIADTLGEANGLTELEAAVVRATRDLTRDIAIDDDTWAMLERALGVKGAMELVLLVAHYNYLVRVIAAFQVDLEPEYEEHLARFDPPAWAGAWR